MKKTSGFTLIELMIAVAVVGILVAVAYPSYTNYLVKGNRGAAQAFLMEVAQTEQQFLLDSRSYVAVANNAAFAGSLRTPVPGEVSRFYEVSVDAPGGTPPTFTATATPKAGTRQANDGALSITNTGTKAPADKW